MADFDDPGAPAARFSLDNDYEGGEFGDDGEFYAMGQKRGKTQSKDKALYGVFDDSSDEEGGRRPGFGGGKKRKEPANYSAPVGFVSGGLKGQEKKFDDSERSGSGSGGGDDDDDDDDEDEGAHPHFGLGGGRRGKDGSRRRGRYSDPEDSDESGEEGGKKGGRDQDAELPMSFGAKPKEREKKPGSWGADREQIKPSVDPTAMNRLKQIDTTGGVALRMLQKMGYKGGGLGATGQGITTAIEAHKRGEKEGIGVKSEAKQLMPEKQQQEKEKEQKKKEKEKKKKKAKQESNWKIDIDDGPRKKKKVYKTAEELRAEAEEAGGLKQGEMRQASQHVSIVDMRGKEAKLVSGSDINQVQDTDADEAFTLPLIHNLDVLIEGSSSDIFNLQRNLSTEADSLVALKHEEAEAQRLCDEDRYHVSRLSSIIDILDRTHAQASDTAAEPLTLSGLADVFEELRSSYDSEYTLYGLASLAGPLLVPPMRRFLAKWNVLDEPHGPAPAIKAWRGLLRSDRGGAVSDGGDAVAFVQLVDNVVMPKILAASAGWEPRSMTERVVRLAEAWEPVLPPRQFVTLMETVVVPKLREAADLWDPKHDPTPVHLWMHPWLPFIPERLEEIYPVIRYKIGVCLAEWHPSDPSAIAILSPWATVFKKQHMEALLVRCVLPKLAMALREMPINPAAQTLDAFRWLTAWVGVAPLDQIAAIFEAEFFPRWLSVLFQWLTRSPDYDEVTRWYLNWKSLFPDKLSAHEKIKVHFTRALDIMNNVVSGAQILGGYVQPGTKENLDYLKVTESRGGGVGGGGAAGGGAGAKKDVPVPASKPKMSIVDANHDRTVSFKEALEQLAEDNEILFLPKVGKQEKGKQVYTFGKISVYLDNRLVYALSAGEWRPMALDELLEAAKKKK